MTAFREASTGRDWKILIGVLVCFGVACGGDDDRSRMDAGGGGRDGGGSCENDEDCDDSAACTIDSCGVGNTCRYDPIAERCPGQICEPFRGCVDEPSCTSDEACDDGFSCTLDSCGVGGECRNMPLDELCESVGPGSTCAPATGMATTGCTEATGCAGDEDCDDEVECTLDVCGVDAMCDHTLIDERCPEGEACTLTGCFAPMDCTDSDMCQDGDFCNGAEFCEDEFGCRPSPAPRVCMDTDDCTIDSCEPSLGDGGACLFRCDTSRPECDCPVAETPCDGIFDISPVPTQRCADFGSAQVDYSVSEVEFSCIGSVLSVDARDVPNPSINSALTQSPRSGDDTFMVEAVVEGGCEERYRITATFVDETTFMGTWEAEYIEVSGLGECAFSGCRNQTVAITGTRR